jgi:hypothetical protein
VLSTSGSVSVSTTGCTFELEATILPGCPFQTPHQTPQVEPPGSVSASTAPFSFSSALSGSRRPPEVEPSGNFSASALFLHQETRPSASWQSPQPPSASDGWSGQLPAATESATGSGDSGGLAVRSGTFTAAWDVTMRRRRFIKLDLFVFALSHPCLIDVT